MAVATTATTKRAKSSDLPTVVSVYRAMDGGIHHARCGLRMSYRGVSASGVELEFHCASCHERVILPQTVASRLPLVTSAA
jgi:hypothetical protein